MFLPTRGREKYISVRILSREIVRERVFSHVFSLINRENDILLSKIMTTTHFKTTSREEIKSLGDSRDDDALRQRQQPKFMMCAT